MEDKIYQDIVDYLGEDFEFTTTESTLRMCVKRAIQSFKRKRRYPSTYSDEFILKDMEMYSACVFDLSLYWCVKQGIEFQDSHNENYMDRSFNSESEIYALHDVIPIAVVI